MSLTPTNHAHGVLHVTVDATGNNSLHISINTFYWFYWGVPRMGLQVLFAPYLLVAFFSFFFLFFFYNCTLLFIVYTICLDRDQ